METNEILNELRGIKNQALVAIQTNQILFESATNLQRKLEEDQGPFKGSGRRKVSDDFEQQASKLMVRRKLKYLKK